MPAPKKPLVTKKFGRKLGRVAGRLARVGAALATGGASELALLAVGPNRMFPQRRQIGRLDAGIHPALTRGKGGASRRTDGKGGGTRPPVPTPPVATRTPTRRAVPPPPGRLYPQRRFTARARAGMYRHLRRGES